MAGILDSKTRFIDMIVTQEGKRQISTGGLRAKYASISDDQTFYDPLEVDDVSNRIFFQSMGSHNEVIVLEKDDSGRLIEFNFSPTGSIVGNDIFDKTQKLHIWQSLIFKFHFKIIPLALFFHQG